ANFAAQVLYPIRWLEAAFSPELGASVGVAAHLAVAAAGAFWLSRTFGLGRLASASGALMYAFAGTTLDLMLHSHYIVAGAWLPVVWAAARSLLLGRSPRWAL